MTKGIVQPQIKTLSSFTHSHVDPNILCIRHKKIFWRMLVTKLFGWPTTKKQKQKKKMN